MKNIFNEFKRQIFSHLNIILSVLLLGIILWLFIDFENLYHYQQELQDIQIALLTLMIPLAMELYKFSDTNSDNKESFPNKFIKSKNLIKEELIKNKFPIGIILLIIFISTILSILGISNYLIFYTSLIAHLILAYFILDIFNILNNPNSREEFYKKILEGYNNENLDRTIDLWESHWSNKTEINLPYDSTIEIFIRRLENKRTKKENEEIWRLLGVFYKYIDNRKIIPKIIIVKLFEYIYIFLKESEESAEHNGSPSKYIEAHEIYRISEEILIKILQKSLQDPHPSSATIDFFEALDQHLQKYKDETIQFHGKEKSYFEFFKYFGDRVITEILNSKDVFVARDVLDYHWSKSDRNWKINLSNLESEKDNKITYYWLNRMLEYLYKTWKEQIFYTSTKKLKSKDIQKINILLNSFMHNIDVILFMRVVELVWFKRVVNESVKNYLEKRVFWFLDNVEMYIDNSSPEENLEYEKIIIEKQQRETVLLLKKIYKLNDNFYKDIKSQIEAIDRNSLDDEQKGRLESLQKTIDYFINNK
jgi:hypothetical protein